VLAATARAPLTAILLLFELTRDYRIVLPLMAAVGLSTWLAERLPGWSTAASDAWQTTAVTTLAKPEAEASLVVADALLPVPLRLDGHTSLAIAAQALLQQRCPKKLRCKWPVLAWKSSLRLRLDSSIARIECFWVVARFVPQRFSDGSTDYSAG
ncbi:MAG: chloride channel protein, partial [Isosphaeraceae bacterium]